MNDFFDAKRFARYFRYELMSGAKQYLLVIGSAIGVMLIFVLYHLYLTGSPSYEYIQFGKYSWAGKDPMLSQMETIFNFGLWISVCIGASLVFNNLKKKEGRVSVLMIPASSFEKFLTRWLIFVPLALIAFVCSFEIVDLIRCLIVKIRFDNPHNCQMVSLKYLLCPSGAKWMWAFLVLFCSIFALGSSIWPSRSVQKTILACFAILILCMMYGVFLGNMLFKPGYLYGQDSLEVFDYQNLFIGAIYVWALIFYVISYFRYREIEIIQRW